MARPARPHPGASGVTRYASVPDPGFPDAGFPDPGIPDAGSGWAADIVELIMADHRRIERLCRTLYDTARYDRQPRPDWMPGHVWQRLADLLVAHTQAEEQTCYASASCAGAQDAGPVRDSISDHDDIRKIIGEASSHSVGSAPWWHAVRTVMAVSAEHHEREERYVLPSCVLGLDMNRRKELGRRWCAFMAAWGRDGARRAGTPHQPV
jgi:hypothetical protein